MELTNFLKRYYPESLIVLGGPLASSAYNIFLKHTSSDFVVLGEGELTFPSLIEIIHDDFSSFPTGIAYKSNGSVHITGSTTDLVNLDSLTDLDWSIYPNLKNNTFLFSYLISRGCNRKCSYCNPMFDKIRTKSPEKIKRELQYLKNMYGLKSLILNDLNFLQIGSVADYCNVLRELEIKWSCFSRPEKLNPLLLKSLKEHGCVNMRFGIESFDQNVLDTNLRDINAEDMKGTIQMAIDSGIQKITGYFI
nr:B12-binding domain-containing radical SAM protein [Deltaproteobacteria bacterium]